MKVRIADDPRRCELELAASDEVELGRQTEAETKHAQRPYTVLRDDTGNVRRVVIAWASESADFSRRHVKLTALPDGQVRITNLSETLSIPTPGTGEPIRAGQSADLSPPFSLSLPRRTVTVEEDDRLPGLLRRAEQAPGTGTYSTPIAFTLPPALLAPHRQADPQFNELITWLQTTMRVLQDAVGSADFLSRAAEALVQIVGLNSGLVLLRRDGRWDDQPTVTFPPTAGARGLRPSTTILDKLLEQRTTLLEDSEDFQGSLVGMAMVVAAPLVDAAGEVAGVLYGQLPQTDGTMFGGADLPVPLKAVLVDMLACGVSAGLARQRQEREAARAQALFEQFFSESLARQLRDRPDMLKSKTATVTILFCDIRGYSTVSRRLGPEKTEEWLHEVLGVLSRCVIEEDGVLVDYIGDELLAMWGAPQTQPDQTERAVRAGLNMLRALAGLNRTWRERVGADVEIGIGINRGEAQVGNWGSKYKFKYGALGDTVNIASRVQGMTKYLKCRLLVTKTARGHLGSKYAARRVVLTKLVNIDEPVDLYEVAAAGEGRAEFFAASESALDTLEQALDVLAGEGKFDKGAFANAARQAGAQLEAHPSDGPLILTLSRATDALVRDGQGCAKVWMPPGK
jgi:adenylate cyclase